MHRNISFILLIAFFCACTVKPKEIIYGEDKCVSCLMTIVDARFAAEAVTDKGKVFKFDAIECLGRYLDKDSHSSYAFIQVANYQHPEHMLDARNSYYLFSKSIPSPMGGFLSAYVDEKAANQQKSPKGGELMDWEELKNYVSNQK